MPEELVKIAAQIFSHDALTYIVILVLAIYVIASQWDVRAKMSSREVSKSEKARLDAEAAKIEAETDVAEAESEKRRLEVTDKLNEMYAKAYQDLLQVNADLKASYADLDRRFEKMSCDVIVLRSELDARAARESELKTRVESLVFSIEQQSRHLEEQRKHEEKLTEQITILQARVLQLETQNKALAAQIEVLQQERDHWKGIAENSASTSGSPG